MLEWQGCHFSTSRAVLLFLWYLLGFHRRFDLSKGSWTLKSLKVTRVRVYIYIYMTWQMKVDLRSFTRKETQKCVGWTVNEDYRFWFVIYPSIQIYIFRRWGRGMELCQRPNITHHEGSTISLPLPPPTSTHHVGVSFDLGQGLGSGITGRKGCYFQPQVWIYLLILLPLHPLFYKTS